MSTLEVLNHVFPKQSFKQMRFLGEGLDSRAYLVDERYVFRFPKRAEVARSLTREIALLPHLQNLPLRVPDFQFVGNHPETGMPFVGYPLLNGIEWSEQTFDSQPPDQQAESLERIGGFLTQLHRFDVDRALQLGVDIQDSRQDYLDTYREIQTDLFPLLTPEQQHRIHQRFDAFLADERNVEYTNCLIHDDFSTDHILSDPKTGIPRAVIDFGDVAVGDPDLDLKYLYDELGQSFIGRLLASGHYQTPTEPTVLIAKLRFFNFCEVIQDAFDQHGGNPQPIRAALSLLLGT